MGGGTRRDRAGSAVAAGRIKRGAMTVGVDIPLAVGAGEKDIKETRCGRGPTGRARERHVVLAEV